MTYTHRTKGVVIPEMKALKNMHGYVFSFMRTESVKGFLLQGFRTDK